MSDLIHYLLYWILRILLSLRYRIQIEGLSKIIKSKQQGILFLPNHPAEIDPPIIMRVLWSDFKPRPLAVEHFYYQKGIRFFMNLVGALPLPTVDVANQWKVRQIEKLKKKVLEKLDEGGNFLIYPSGKLKVTSQDQVGGASFIPELLAKNPEIKIVLIRIRGLWGSMFSRALTGERPDFSKTLWKGFKILLKNGIFFIPRRNVKIDLEFAPEDFPRMGSKMEINNWLENWYNKEGPEPLCFVSHSFWKEKFPQVIVPEEIAPQQEVPISQEMRAQILDHLSKISCMDRKKMDLNFHLSNDLGLDSIDVAQLHVYLEERFDIIDLAPGQLQFVRDVLQAAGGVKKEHEGPIFSQKKSKWPKESFRHDPMIPKGNTLQEVFLKSCDRMGDSIACADALSGALSYKKLKRSVLVLSLKIKEMPGEKIGILLPSSVAAYVTILATLFAGKVPVLLNWTAGFRNLEHAVDICSLKVVLSSYRFLSRLENGDMGRVDDLLLLLEELRRNISFKTKIKGLFLSFLGTKMLLRKLPTQSDPKDAAAIIFTSGSETLPKGVPLSHQNFLSCLRGGKECIDLLPTDILYGVLPPFHSFGLSVTGFFPLLSGLKVYFAPDPTDARAMANDIEFCNITLMCSAPSFLLALLRVATEEQLKSLRLVLTGAEKGPKELFDLFEKMGKTIIEGYGISECSPIVTVTRENEPRKGVGKPIPGVQVRVLDLETQKLCNTGQEGEICIFGLNVFAGYLGEKRDPFIEIDGNRWYRSGDRGYLDKEGNLILTGRLKRFIKIGAEMVSLGGLEEDLIATVNQLGWVPAKSEGPVLAVTAKGPESDKPQIVVFSTFEIDKEVLNRRLKESGQGRLVKIAKVVKMDEIPITGTGKIHYRHLNDLLENS